MSSASSAVTYTSVYIDSEPGRVFWGADDEEISEGGIPRTLRITSTQTLIDAVTVALPSPLLPPSLYIPPPVDHREDIPESEQPSRKRLCLSTIGSRYEIGESSTARHTGGRGIDYGFISTVDAEERRQGVRDVGVTELAELHEYDTQDLYALLEDAKDSRSHISQRVDMDSLRTQRQVYETRFQTQQAEIAAHQESDRRRQAQMAGTLRVMRDMRREISDMQAELLAHQEQQGIARQPGPDARILDHQDASGDADSHV
ncbi:hypothetical protein Tco_1355813 [Tanacetum coccineum]